MRAELPSPRLTGGTVQEQMAALQSWLYQLTERLNWALDTLETAPERVVLPQSTALSEQQARSAFGAIKSLILKSGDIVDAYAQKIGQKLTGEFAAQSEFGSFREEMRHTVSESSADIRRAFSDVQTLISRVDGVDDALIAVNAHVRTGLLEYRDGVGVYGVEVGQRTEEGGQETFRKFARFTADRLSFYDKNGAEVSYISDYKLHITNAVVKGTLQLGGYGLDTAAGIAFKWVGR